MAAGDLWRRMSTIGLGQDRQLPPTLILASLVELLSTAPGTRTLAQVRAFLQLQNSDENTEFNDLVLSINSIPAAGGLPAMLRKFLCIAALGASHTICGQRRLRLASLQDPNLIWYATADELRQRARDLVIDFGGTPQGTLAS